MLPIRWLTVHCAATPEGRDVRPDTIAAWDKAKFGQESYHWIITLDGAMHRRLKDSERGAHTGGHNTGNIGVCYVGGMDKTMSKPRDTKTPMQERALITLIRTYRARYPGIKILGHRDWPGVKKACPSFDVEEWMIETGI